MYYIHRTYLIIFCLSNILWIFSAFVASESVTPALGVNVGCVSWSLPRPMGSPRLGATCPRPMFSPKSAPTPIGVPTWLNPSSGVSVAIRKGVVKFVRFGWSVPLNSVELIVLGKVKFCGIVDWRFGGMEVMGCTGACGIGMLVGSLGICFKSAGRTSVMVCGVCDI